jgi:hypothetical protein
MPGNYNSSRRKGLHLVAAPRRSPTQIRLTSGNFIADVLSSKGEENSFHYIVQRAGSAEILELAKYDDFEQAKAAAERALDRWHSRDELSKAS